MATMTFAEYERVNFGYEVMTTFWEDFSIADHFGVSAIKNTYKRAFNEWKSNYKYLTELVMVLNTKCWMWYDKGNDDYSKLYADLYHEANDWAGETMSEEEYEYYFNIID